MTAHKYGEQTVNYNNEQRMGSDQSVSEYPEQQAIAHGKFNKIRFVKDNQILRTCIAVESEEDVLKWDRRLKEVSDCDDEYLLLPKSYTYSKKAVCGSSGIVEIDFDNYPYLLHEEIENRRPNHNHFTQTEMWYLVYALASSAYIFKNTGSKVGDIRPQNIFINECGQVRIANLCSWPAEHTNYQKSIYEHELTYLSPEEVEDSKQGKTHLTHDQFISQAFTIGVTLIETGMLRSSAQLYDHKKKLFHYDELRKRISRWFDLEMKSEQGHKERYSWALKLTLASLCEVNPKDRLTCDGLYHWLSPYDSEISNLRPIKLGMPPIKNIEKYQEMMGAGNRTPIMVTPNKFSPLASRLEDNSRASPPLHIYRNVSPSPPPQQQQYGNFSPSPRPQQYRSVSKSPHPSPPRAHLNQTPPNVLFSQYPQHLNGEIVPISIKGRTQSNPAYITSNKPAIGQSINAMPFQQFPQPYTFQYIPSLNHVDYMHHKTQPHVYQTQSQPQTYKTQQVHHTQSQQVHHTQSQQVHHTQSQQVHHTQPPLTLNTQPNHNIQGYNTQPSHHAEGYRTQPNQSSSKNKSVRPSFGNMSSIEKRRDSGERPDEASLDFLRRINDNIQKSQEKYSGVQR